MQLVFLALLRDPALRRALGLQVQDLPDPRRHGCLCASRMRPRERRAKLVQLRPWHRAGVAAVGPHARDGRGFAEVLADGVQQRDPLPLRAKRVDELEAGKGRLPRAFEQESQPTVHEVPLGVSKALAVGLVAGARPVGVCLGLRKQGHQHHPALFVVRLPRVVGDGDVHGERRVLAQAVESGLVDVHDDGDEDVWPFISWIGVNL